MSESQIQNPKSQIVHPFAWLPEAQQKVVFWPLFVFTLLVMAAMQVIGDPLKSAAAPSGIVSFELAGDLAAAQGMVAAWSPTARVFAGLSLGLDYLFMAAYASAIALGCVLVARGLAARAGFLATAGIVLAWGQFLAAILDATENYSLIQVLLGSKDALWPALSWWCAVPKFAIIGVGLLYVIVGAVVLLAARMRGER